MTYRIRSLGSNEYLVERPEEKVFPPFPKHDEDMFYAFSRDDDLYTVYRAGENHGFARIAHRIEGKNCSIAIYEDELSSSTVTFRVQRKDNPNYKESFLIRDGLGWSVSRSFHTNELIVENCAYEIMRASVDVENISCRYSLLVDSLFPHAACIALAFLMLCEDSQNFGGIHG